MKERTSLFSAVLLLLVLVCSLLIYRQGTASPWLFDDHPNLTRNSLIKIDVASFDEWRTAALSTRSGPLGRPVAMVTFAANHAISGELSREAVKATNVLLHGVIGVLVYLLCAQLLGHLGWTQFRSLAAATAAGIWLLHPLHVTTVLYAVQRMAQLSTLFVLLGLVVFVRYRRAWAVTGASAGEVLAAGFWLALLTALAALSKENGLLLPWLAVVVEICFFRGQWNGETKPWLAGLGWSLLIVPALLLAALPFLSADYFAYRYSLQNFTLEERLLTQARALWHYVGWLVFPDVTHMALYHDDIPLSRSLFEPVTTLVSICGWILAVSLAVVLRGRYPLLLFAVLFFLVGHAMESSIWPLMLAFEHRSYLPSVGLFLLISAVIFQAGQSPVTSARLVPALVLLIGLAGLLHVRVTTWSDELHFSGTDVFNHPESANSHYTHANVMFGRAADLGEQDPNDPQVEVLLGGARHHYEMSHSLDPQDVATLVMLYQMDSAYYPHLGLRDLWLEKLDAVLETRSLRPTDIVALGKLMRCFGSGACQAEAEVVPELLDTLYRRFPGSARIALLEHRYQVDSGVELTRRVAFLESLLVQRPDNTLIRRALQGEYVAQGDGGRMIENARLLMQGDTRRVRLPDIRLESKDPDTPDS
jgi:hypothetical protein